jgi:ribose-phosphate pyrophosphokinase
MVNVAKLSSADEVNAVIPYFGYGRGDQKNKSRVTIAAALAAKEIQLAGANRILTMDLHAEQTVGMVDIPWDNIYARPVILEEVEKMGLEDLVFVAADAGGVKRAVAFQNLTVGNSNIAVAYKIRPRANEVEVLRVVGDLEGKDAFIAEDVIDTAGTIVDVAKAVKACGAKRIFVAAAHGIFSTDKYGVPALQKIDESPIDQIIITDSIKQPPAVVNHPRIKIVSIVDMFAEAMLRIHTGESVGQLIPSINGKKH